MGIFSYGEAEYDIDDLKIAVWNGDGTYGTLIDVPGVDEFRIEFTLKSQQGRGDGGLILVASGIEAANVVMRNFGIVAAMLPVLFGASNDAYGAGDAAYNINDMVVGKPLPYFGAMIRSFDNESTKGGGALLFVPKIKVMQTFQWNFAYNTFIQPELTGMALKDDNLQANVAGYSKFVRKYGYKANLPQITVMPPVF